MDVDEDGNPIGNRFGLTLRDPAGVSPNLSTVTVHIDQVPSIGTSTYPHSPRTCRSPASDAIPDEDVNLYIDGVLNKTVTADDDGNYFGRHRADRDADRRARTPPDMTSVDADGIESSASETADFDVAPSLPGLRGPLRQRPAQTAPSSAIALTGVDPAATQVTLYHLVEVSGVGTEVEIGNTTVVTSGTATITLRRRRRPGVPRRQADGRRRRDGRLPRRQRPLTAIVNTSAPTLETASTDPVTNDNRPYFYARACSRISATTTTRPRSSTSTACPPGMPTATAAATSRSSRRRRRRRRAHRVRGHGRRPRPRSTVHSNTVAFTTDTVGPRRADRHVAGQRFHDGDRAPGGHRHDRAGRDRARAGR